ncbi:Aste57867_4780 [Aphanomyces stellatus]|uniref:Aste57867_4780 protein n=1 Tax=Aphanomyces stellatus TaxID=120398 RepID=A0A485KFY6_9STRA|nr:hypothetical protein As57867_004767 [Aphanomyces stellatus]VFT81875.1 Aste57867_4780 [Aphanomyces stellatus]
MEPSTAAPTNAAEAFDKAILEPQSRIAVIHSNYVSASARSIVINVADDFTIRDAHTDAVLFRIAAKRDVYCTRTLVDVSSNMPVAVIQEPVLTGRHRQRVYTPEMEPWFDVVPHLTFVTNPADCDVVDCVTGATHTFSIGANALARKVVVTRLGETVAKMHKPKAIASKQYLVDIAPGMDMAFVALLCLAVDEASNIHLLPVMSMLYMPFSFL